MKRSTMTWLCVLSLALSAELSADLRAGLPAQEKKAPEDRYAIVGGKIVTVTKGTHDNGVVLVRGKKIEKVIPKVEADYKAPAGYRVIDAKGRWIVPGYIELHSHIGGESSDLNDIVYPTNEGYRTLDTIVTENPLLKRAQAGGVTTVLFIPGSGTNMGGFGTLIKTAGKSYKDALVRFPGALKIAQGGNPERRGGDIGYSRIGMNFLIRRALREGQQYTKAWADFSAGKTKVKPAKNPRLEMLKGLFERKYPVVVHTQGYHLIHSTLRILHDEMKLWVVIDHGTFDGYRMAPEVAERGVMVMNGPRQLEFNPRTGSYVGLAHEWYRGGVTDVGVNTDAPVVPGEELGFQATMAARLGLNDETALAGLTISPARAVGIDDRCGSIEEGKDADLVFWTGNPLDVRNHVTLCIINGKICYDPSKEPRRF
ncbi:MAG: amidohydrolase family protein [Planctomycetota bacterium]